MQYEYTTIYYLVMTNVNIGLTSYSQLVVCHKAFVDTKQHR